MDIINYKSVKIELMNELFELDYEISRGNDRYFKEELKELRKRRTIVKNMLKGLKELKDTDKKYQDRIKWQKENMV